MIIVTGIKGLLGGRLARYLVRSGVDVIGTSRCANDEYAGEVARATGADILTMEAAQHLANDRPIDAIIHAAGPAAAACKADPEKATSDRQDLANDVMALAKLHQARLCVFSTTDVYPQPLAGAIDISTPTGGAHSPYAASHLAAEAVIASGAQSLAQPPVILRLGNMYGAPVVAGAPCWHLLMQHACRSAMIEHAVQLNDATSSFRAYSPIRALEQIIGRVLAPVTSLPPVHAQLYNFAPAGPAQAGKMVLLVKALMKKHFDMDIEINFDEADIQHDTPPYHFTGNWTDDGKGVSSPLMKQWRDSELVDLLSFCRSVASS